ncbi:phenylalanine--tRNA ligase beta subunit-related protein [Streptomyces syringium]|uniref:phenylalanine--tRNA ligase beta subunit-related protein n=1 Tax=Streptomyces syringium TaxID=76729 RepID=UPI0034546F9E
MKLTIAGLRAFVPGLPEDVPTFRDALDASGLEVKGIETDGRHTVVNLEFLANRGDHRSYAGVADELVARLGLTRAGLPAARLTTTADTRTVTVESERCLAYTLTPLTVTDPGATLPADTLERLSTAGLSTGVTVVDAARAAGLETGQPVHAFDADLVTGPVVVRESRPGETIRLDAGQAPRELTAGTLVVADREKLLAVAGVAGGTEAAVSAATRRVLLESAAYDPVSVRLAAGALGLSTPSSQRYERGSDPTAPLAGAGRAVALLENAGAAARDGDTAEPVRWAGPLPTVAIDPVDCARFLGLDLTLDDMADRLADYGFRQQEPGVFQVPGTRIWDVREPEDLYEELARHIGFDELPGTTLPAGTGALPTRRETLLRIIGDTLVGLGFYETFTEGFYGRDTLKLLSPAGDHPLASHVRIGNAEDRRYSMLKNNCLAQAVAAAADNLRFKQDQIRLFEATRVFEPRPEADNGLCHERPVVWALALGNSAPMRWSDKAPEMDFFFLRGAVEEIALRCRADVRFVPLPPEHPLADFLHPHRSARILLGDRPAGVLGEVHPDVRHRAGLGGKRPGYVELDIEEWEYEDRPAVLPPFREDPPVERMLDFVTPRTVTSEEILAVMRAAAPDWLRTLRVMDVFVPAKAAPGERSITYLITFDSEPARTAEEINGILDVLVAAVITEFGDAGVCLR